jgi:hypothetical protein
MIRKRYTPEQVLGMLRQAGKGERPLEGGGGPADAGQADSERGT